MLKAHTDVFVSKILKGNLRVTAKGKNLQKMWSNSKVIE